MFADVRVSRPRRPDRGLRRRGDEMV